MKFRSMTSLCLLNYGTTLKVSANVKITMQCFKIIGGEKCPLFVVRLLTHV